jgi:hypothetical protein
MALKLAAKIFERPDLTRSAYPPKIKACVE